MKSTHAASSSVTVPRHAVVPAPHSVWELPGECRQILDNLRDPSVSIPHSSRDIRQAFQYECKIPKWKELVVATWEQRWSAPFTSSEGVALYAKGVEIFGPKGQRLADRCLHHLSTPLPGIQGRDEDAERNLSLAVMAAGTPLQIHSTLAPMAKALGSYAAYGTEDTRVIVGNADDIADTLMDRYDILPDERQSQIIQPMTEHLRACPDHGGLTGSEIFLSRMLFRMEEHHPSGIHWARSRVTGRLPERRDRPGQCATTTGSKIGSHAHEFVRWCQRQVATGDLRPLVNDDLLMTSLASLAISGSLPGTEPGAVSVAPQDHARACALFGVVSAHVASEMV